MPEQNSPIVTLTRALAEAFGEGWTAIPSPHTQQVCHLAGPDAALAVVEPHPDEPRQGTAARIVTALPLSIPERVRSTVGHGVEHTEIKVTATRPVEGIRRDIERRILPYARTVHSETLARGTRLHANITARHELRDELVARMPHAVVARESVDDNTNLTTFATGGSEVHGGWQVNRTGTSVTVTLSHLTPEQARRIAELLYPQNAADTPA